MNLFNNYIEVLIAAGVKEFCICPGGRCSVLVQQIENSKSKIHYFVDERSASFFALGRSLSLGRKPVVVVVTSGTAVAETLAAVIEAHYSQVPLVVLSADRPKRFRGKGAPQSIQQATLLSGFVEQTHDLSGESLELPAFSSPIHVNICFEEKQIKFMDSALNGFSGKDSKLVRCPQSQSLAALPCRTKVQNPLVVVGSLSEKQRPLVSEFLKKIKIPIHLEVTSNLWSQATELPTLLEDSLSVSEALNKYKVNLIRLGGVPSGDFWRKLTKDTSVLSFDSSPYSGSEVLDLPPYNLNFLKDINLVLGELGNQILKFDFNLAKEKKNWIAKNSCSEAAWVFSLSKALNKKNCRSLFLGNSLPIRLWNQFAEKKDYGNVTAFRGANGIDGQISGFLGWALSKLHQPAWAVVGDLTVFHDVSAFWIAQQMKNLPLRIVVLNNQGGGIFRQFFPKMSSLVNTHEHGMKEVADLLGWGYRVWQKPSDTSTLFSDEASLSKAVLIEIKCDQQPHPFVYTQSAVCGQT